MTIYLNYIDNYFSLCNTNNLINLSNFDKEKKGNNKKIKENDEIKNNEKYNIINSHNNKIKFGLGKIKYSDEICLKVKSNIIDDKLLELIDDFDFDLDKNNHKNIIFENLNLKLKFNVSVNNWKKFCKNINILVFNGIIINNEFKLKHLLCCKNLQIFIIDSLHYNLFQEKDNEEYYINIMNLKKLRVFDVNINCINHNFELYNKLKNILQNKNVKLILNYF